VCLSSSLCFWWALNVEEEEQWPVISLSLEVVRDRFSMSAGIIFIEFQKIKKPLSR